MARRSQKTIAPPALENDQNLPEVGEKKEVAAPPAPSPMKFAQGANYRNIYANSVKVPISQWDIGLTFGLIVEKDGGGNMVQDEVTVKMSPQYFKTFVDAVSTSLKEWEKLFGGIHIGLGQSANTKGLVEAFEKLQASLSGGPDKKH